MRVYCYLLLKKQVWMYLQDVSWLGSNGSFGELFEDIWKLRWNVDLLWAVHWFWSSICWSHFVINYEQSMKGQKNIREIDVYTCHDAILFFTQHGVNLAEHWLGLWFYNFSLNIYLLLWLFLQCNTFEAQFFSPRLRVKICLIL